jgi:predicted  nucleic acid-binding Zn-ribbon protein
MPLIQMLCELQEIDQEWVEKGRLYQAVRQRLTDDSELNARRQARETQQQELQAQTTRLHNAELELDGLNDPLEQTVGDLYGGRIRAPKELEHLRQDSEHMRIRIGELEEEALAAMTHIEELQAAIQHTSGELQAFEAQRLAERSELQGHYSTLHARLQQLQSRRQALRGRIQESALALYDELRVKKGGQALASLKEGVCQVCRVSVPSAKIEAVQRGESIALCDGCGRILYPVR